MHAEQIISTHPQVRGSVNQTLARCLDECHECALSCTVCADACVGEDMVVDLRQCIRLCLDCADLCEVTGTVGARRTGSNESVIRQVLLACAEACARCAEECERHAQMHEHCRICAESCRRCERACREAAQTL